MKKTLFMFVIIFSLLYPIEQVRVRPPQSEEDSSNSYFVALLQLALDKTEEEYGKAEVEITDFNVTQARALIELENGKNLDVDWAGTDIEREKRLEAIRIPLIGGLLGYRVPVIKKEDKELFDHIYTLEDLKYFKAVQGTHWPDSDILESSGLSVLRVPKFGNMYSLLLGGRVDYFPRGINEVYAEVKTFGKGELIAYDELIIEYKFPMYFFTSKKNLGLAKRISIGLNRAIDDGSFMELIKTHPVTKFIFPLEKYKNARIIHIDNPILPKATPVDDKRLWIEL